MDKKILVLASNNTKKIEEINILLKDFNIEVKGLKDLGLGEPIEDGKTFAENALIKAKYAFENTGFPALADDYGFCINSMNNFPGSCSARFIKAVGGEEKAFEVINSCINQKDKSCFFITNLAFVYKTNNQIIEKIFEGKVNGNFVFPARGNGGFGFDPVFIPNNYEKTFAEMLEIKIQISHRTKSLNNFLNFVKINKIFE